MLKMTFIQGYHSWLNVLTTVGQTAKCSGMIFLSQDNVWPSALTNYSLRA